MSRATAVMATSLQEPARTTDALVYGVASHDVYHTGQIQVLKRLQGNRRKG